MSAERPYAATGGTHDSGNGSIMRIAACIAANHRRPMEAVADAVAASLMTHGNSDILKYTALFIQEILSAPGPFNTLLYLNPSSFRDGKGSIMYAFNAARYAIHYGKGDGGEVLRRAVAYGWDTDTNACVAGMWVGAREGIDCFPKEYIDALQNKDRIFEVANKLFEIGASK
jgi:ADP-ribosylglycohydrolase